MYALSSFIIFLKEIFCLILSSLLFYFFKKREFGKVEKEEGKGGEREQVDFF